VFLRTLCDSLIILPRPIFAGQLNQRAYYYAHKEQIGERCRKGANPDHPNQHSYFWTDERQRWLVNLFEENLSTAEIARRMGITRNSVIGRLHRCHMSRREKYSGPTTIERLQNAKR
jgi:hypothetical protein